MAAAMYEKPASIVDLAQRLADLGYWPVPIPAGHKGPTQPGWQNARHDSTTIPAAFQDAGLVGVLHTNVLALDIDIYDESLAEAVMAEAKRRFPGALERIGEPPKSALFFRMEGAGYKVSSTRKYEHPTDPTVTAQVDVRSVSRQTVAYGVHPATGKPYRWPDRELWATPWAELPEAKREDIEQFRDWCEDKIRKWAGVSDQKIIDMGLYHRQDDKRPSSETIKEALQHIPASCGYDEWLEALMGVHDYYSGSQEGLNLAHEWSSAYPHYTAAEVNSKWRSFEVGKGRSYKSLLHAAKGYGADLSAMARRDAGVKPATFEGFKFAAHAEAEQDAEAAEDGAIRLRVQTSQEFEADWKELEFLVEDLIATNQLATLTGYSGHGKTTTAIHLAIQVATGGEFAGKPCEKGGVLFIAGENPDNVRTQYLAAKAAAGIHAPDIHWIAGHFSMSAFMPQLIEAANAIPNLKLIIVDTLQAFFEGEDDNSNMAMVTMARVFRKLQYIPAKPAVLVIAHPAGKLADKTNLTPRGGSSFRNEIDSNFTIWLEKDGVQSFHHDKLRGTIFDPINLVLEQREFDHLTTSKGVPLKVPVARGQLLIEQANSAAKVERRDREALMALDGNPKLSVRTLADCLQVSKSTADRVLKDLLEEKLIRRRARKWEVTKDGKEYLDDA